MIQQATPEIHQRIGMGRVSVIEMGSSRVTTALMKVSGYQAMIK